MSTGSIARLAGGVAAAGLLVCGCSTSGSAAATAPHGGAGGSPTVTAGNGRQAAPFQIAGYSPTMRTLQIQVKSTSCSPVTHITVIRQHHQIEGWPGMIVTITVWEQQAAPGCDSGSPSEQIETVHSKTGTMGCFTRLIDGATGRAPTFVPGVQRPMWSCPAMPRPTQSASPDTSGQ